MAKMKPVDCSPTVDQASIALEVVKLVKDNPVPKNLADAANDLLVKYLDGTVPVPPPPMPS